MTNLDTKALATVTAAPTTGEVPFRSRAGAMADYAAERHVDRWAPEQGATRSGSLRSVAFVDRLITPWFEAPQRMAMRQSMADGHVHGSAARASDSVSWVFPRPWYQDEIDWLAASRSAPGGGRPMMTTRGTYVAPRPSQAAPMRPQAESMSAATVFAGPLDLVAPSLSSSTGSRASVSPAMPAGFPAASSLSAWSPIVPFAAAQAAQLVAHALDNATRAGLGVAERSPVFEALAYVSPVELGGPQATRQSPLPSGAMSVSAPTSRPLGGLTSSAIQTQLAAAVARIDAVAAAEPRLSRLAAAAPDLVTPPAPLAPSKTETAPTTMAALRQAVPAAAPTPPAPAQTAPVARPDAVREAPLAEPRPVAAAPSSTLVAPEPSSAPPAAAIPSTSDVPVATQVAGSGASEAAPPAFAEIPADVASIARLVAGSADAAAALRTVELLTRAAASGAPTLAPSSGPRVAMPAGLGGLAAAIDASHVVSRPLAVAASPASPFAALGAGLEAAQRAPVAPGELAAPGAFDMASPLALALAIDRPAFRAAPAFAPVWAAPTTALGAVSADRPAAISHVAWADRWLARFAGASPRSLDAFDLATSERATVSHSLAGGAPEVVFVSPMFLRRPDDEIARASRGEIAARPTPAAVRPTAPPSTAFRIDDAEAVPDEVFAAIARARSAPTARTAQTSAPAAPGADAAAPTASSPSSPSSPTVADLVAAAPPTAPSAGLGASLASSPVAPALANLLPLPQAPTFDPRSLFGAGLAAAYSAGLLAPALVQLTRFAADAGLSIEDASIALPFSPMFTPSAIAGQAPSAEYVAPQLGEPAREGVPAGRAVASAARAPGALARAAELGAAVATLPSAVAEAARTSEAVAMRSSLLAPALAASVVSEYGEAPLVESPRGSWTPRPGATAEAAHAMAVHHERTAADLAFDFVAPELVLAARVYGFGPVEAAQAARLAVAGRGGLAAMATAVDLTFLRAVQGRTSVADGRGVPQVLAMPGAPAPSMTAPAPSMTVPAPSLPAASPAVPATVEPITAYPSPPSPGERSELFGVSRRLPRGAFLWPAGAVAALGLEAVASEDAQLPLAALELLAASAVADLGTWVAARGADAAPIGRAAPATFSPDASAMAGAAPAAPGRPALGVSAPTMTIPSGGPSWDAGDGAAAPYEAVQRARFEAVYLALAHSPEGVSMSPSARVARALSVMARGDETLRGSALERAAAAWSVLPVVIGGDAPSVSSEAAPSVDSRPGLARLSAQAGDFLGSFVSPSVREIIAAARSGGVAGRAPSTDYVQVGSDAAASERAASSSSSSSSRGRGSFARYGGGEVEIPSWFEAAARSMFADRGGGLGDGISLAELTLIAAAPPSQIAASTRTTGGPSAGTAAPAGAGMASGPEKPDIDAMALEVYTELLKLMDIARERNGEPYV